MTPTANDLREVGLRGNNSHSRKRCVWVVDDQLDCVPIWRPRIGQRTLGEYWRRRRMVAEARILWSLSEKGMFRTLAARRWKAWPKPGWSRKGKGQR